jgi:hypothetical protein
VETLEQEREEAAERARLEAERRAEEERLEVERKAEQERLENERKAKAIAARKSALESEKSALTTELSNLKGLFTGKRRKEIEARLAEIETERKGLWSMKNKIRTWVVLAIIFVVYSVITFALPFAHTATFWLSYVFAVVAIAVQVYILHTAFMKEKSIKSKFYGFPIANIGFFYLIAQLVLGLIMMALSAKIAVWIPVVLYVILLGVAAVGFIAADAMRDEVERQDVQLKKDVSVMRGLQSKVNGIVGLCSAAVREDVAKLAEELRYSDPVSSEAIASVEKELSACVDELQAAVVDGDNAAVRELCRKASVTLVERNRLCKLNK